MPFLYMLHSRKREIADFGDGKIDISSGEVLKLKEKNAGSKLVDYSGISALFSSPRLTPKKPITRWEPYCLEVWDTKGIKLWLKTSTNT